MRGRPALTRFIEKYRRTETCWQWTGTHTDTGYGKVFMDRRLWQAHRAAYVLYIGPIPDGLDIDHLCENKGCVNPEHLRPLDHRTNVLRGNHLFARRSRMTVCEKGLHDLPPANTIPENNGVNRRCRECRRASTRAGWNRNKDEYNRRRRE